MRCRGDAPRRLVEAETEQNLEAERPLLLCGEMTRDARGRGRRRGLDERDQLLLQPLEDRAYLSRGELRLVVVEQRVVRLGSLREARDVAILELDHLLEPGTEALEVGGPARLHPGAEGKGPDTRRLRGQLRRHTRGLVVVAASHPDQARVVRVVRRAVLVRPKLLEQAADLVRDEKLVRETAERRQLLRAYGCSEWRHDRLLV